MQYLTKLFTQGQRKSALNTSFALNFACAHVIRQNQWQWWNFNQTVVVARRSLYSWGIISAAIFEIIYQLVVNLNQTSVTEVVK